MSIDFKKYNKLYIIYKNNSVKLYIMSKIYIVFYFYKFNITLL